MRMRTGRSLAALELAVEATSAQPSARRGTSMERVRMRRARATCVHVPPHTAPHPHTHPWAGGHGRGGATAGAGGRASESVAASVRNMLVVTFRGAGGRHVTLRLGCKDDASLLFWHDGLQVVLRGYRASRLFTGEAHASWVRSIIEAVDKTGGGLRPKLAPALFVAANVVAPEWLIADAIERATNEPLRFQQVRRYRPGRMQMACTCT